MVKSANLKVIPENCQIILISIIIPVFNEVSTVRRVIHELERLKDDFDIEIIVVDDGSTDGTAEILKLSHYRVDQLILHKRNIGKGAAVRTGLRYAKGQVVVIQDADLEYNVEDLKGVIEPVKNGTAQICFGSRMHGRPRMRLTNYLANRFLSFLTSIIFGKKISDVETCYKAFDRRVIDGVSLNEHGFGIEIELAFKALKKKLSFCEVPVRYSGRSKAEGKKIRFIDGIKAILCIFKYGMA